MNSYISDSIFYREYDDKNNEEIPYRRCSDERKYDELISNIFSNQYAVYNEEKPSDMPKTKLARWFYNQLYVYPEIRYGGIHGDKVTDIDFIDDIILAKGEINRNNLYYLVGDVGVGKTAFINWLISVKFKKLIDEGKIWFVRIDLEILKQGKIINPYELIYHLTSRIEKICEELPSLIKDAIKEMMEIKNANNLESGKTHKDKYRDRINALIRLNHRIQKKQTRRLIIILDNIDYICESHDYGLFSNNDEANQKHILNYVYKLVHLFNKPGELGYLGANMLIVTRPDGYKLLNDIKKTSIEAKYLTNHGPSYHIITPDWRKVVDTRIKLLKEFIYLVKNEGQRKHFLKIPNAIENDLKSGQPGLINHLMGISNNGLRKMMEFFAQYGWIGGRDEFEGQPRFIYSYPIALITFILNKKVRFSQECSKFQNIYLINKIKFLEGDLNNNEKLAYTYWLKRLILHVINSGYTNLQDLINLFKGHKRGYDIKLIQEALKDLTDCNLANCVNVVRGSKDKKNFDKLYIEKIIINKRGKHCLENIFDRFFYLQLIVEDYQLPMPSKLKNEFSHEILDKTNLDYFYVIDPKDQYIKKGIEMVRIKAKQVLLFLEILDYALTYEQTIYSDVFNSLHKREIKLPNIKRIKADMYDELGKISKSLDNFLNIDDYKKIVEKYSSEINEQLKLIYHDPFSTIESQKGQHIE